MFSNQASANFLITRVSYPVSTRTTPAFGVSRVCYASEMHRAILARRTRLFGIPRAIITVVAARCVGDAIDEVGRSDRDSR